MSIRDAYLHPRVDPHPTMLCSYGLKHQYDHLVCFVPGMLALGAHSGAVTGAKADR